MSVLQPPNERPSGPSIHTVRGLVPPSALGRVLPHEHLLCDLYRVSGQTDHLLNDEELACEELAFLTAAGGTALVETTPIDLGRNPEGLRRISESTGVHIIMGTGWYRQPFYPPEIDRWDTNRLADIMITELTQGVGDTGIRAGIIGEIGVNRDYATAAEERVHRAVARAHLRTGAPITTHASLFPVGLVQLALLREEGVNPAHVIIGHADTYLNHEYHLAVLKAGAYLQFDTIARQHLNPDARRADALVRLLREGWGERLLLSSDRCFRSDLKACGGVGYDVVFTRFFDRLRALGVSDDELRLVTEENPRKILAW
jgi:phosphotriesterase-related protein